MAEPDAGMNLGGDPAAWHGSSPGRSRWSTWGDSGAEAVLMDYVPEASIYKLDRLDKFRSRRASKRVVIELSSACF
jgi:hypothetical protein